MDLIGSLSQQLGIDSSAAETAAGGVLEVVRGHAGPEEAQQIDQKVPEASGWIAKARALAAGGGGGGVMGALSGALGQAGGAAGAIGGLAGLTGMLGKLGIGEEKLGGVLPLVLQFLQARLGGEVANKLFAAVPFLQHFVGGNVGAHPGTGTSQEASGGLGGLLSGAGKLFGGG